MSRKTINLLYDGIKNYDYSFESSMAVQFDYYGINIDNVERSSLTEMYTYIIHEHNVSRELIENCFKTNRLDELIDFYIQKNFVIGNTYIIGEPIQELPIGNESEL